MLALENRPTMPTLGADKRERERERKRERRRGREREPFLLTIKREVIVTSTHKDSF